MVPLFLKFNILFLQTVMATNSTPTMVPPPTPIMAPMPVSLGEMLEKFNGIDFTIGIVSQNLATTSNSETVRISCFSRHRVSGAVKRLVKDT